MRATFSEMHDLNGLQFEIKMAHTFVGDTLSSLTKIYDKFDDDKAVTV